MQYELYILFSANVFAKYLELNDWIWYDRVVVQMKKKKFLKFFFGVTQPQIKGQVHEFVINKIIAVINLIHNLNYCKFIVKLGTET